MALCNTCGKEYTDNSRFCSGCGAKLAEITNVNQNINVVPLKILLYMTFMLPV